MSPQGDRRLPWHLTALVAAATVVPLAILVWLGWRLLEQDRALESQQVEQRVERVADAVVLALNRAMAASESRLAGQDAWPAGVAVVRFAPEGPSVRPARALAFVPRAPALTEAAAAVFAEPENLEFRLGRATAAAEAYRRLARSSDRATEAGALVRLVRTLRSVGRDAEALATARRLDSLDDVAVGGVPASLIGLYSQATLFEKSSDERALREVAGQLRTGLRDVRWALTGPAYWLYAADVSRWLPENTRSEPELLAESVADLSLRPAHQKPFREIVDVRGVPVVVSWRFDGAPQAWLFTPSFVRTHWLGELEAAARDGQASVSLRAGQGVLTLPAGAPAYSGLRADRAISETGLPWKVEVQSIAPPPERTAFNRRRTLLVTGLSLVGLLVLTTGFVLLRAVGRQAALARMQSEFVSAVSHEFRTPLTSMRQFTEMLLEQPELAGERRQQAYAAQLRATDRLSRLVESLLDFGRTEAGARRYRFEPRTLAPIVERVVSDCASDARRTGHEIAFQRSVDVTVPVDEEAIARALGNLIDNAVKYSPAPHPIEVGLERRNGHARLSVRDRGIGIPADEQARIFDRFRRGTEAAALGITGTGIGLAMVADIARAHHGRVEVESVPGAGSTFTLVLPVED